MLFPRTNFINYNNYSGYRMPTTIQIDHETKERLKSFGSKGETYQDIIKRLYDIAVRQQLRELLNSKNAIPIDEAIAQFKRKWQL